MNSRPATFDKAQTHRRAMLAKIHLARKEMRLDEGDYRDILRRSAGHASAADCSDAELARALDEFKRLGWKGAPIRGRRPTLVVVDNPEAPPPRPASAGADHPTARKARALWISLHQLGVVRDAGEHALEAFARRQLQVEKLQWADQARVYRLIEALKAMAERAKWPQSDDVHQLKVGLVEAQWKALAQLGVVGDWGGNAMMTWIFKRMYPRVRQVGGPVFWTDRELGDISGFLAGLIWDAKRRAAASEDEDGPQA